MLLSVVVDVWSVVVNIFVATVVVTVVRSAVKVVTVDRSVVAVVSVVKEVAALVVEVSYLKLFCPLPCPLLYCCWLSDNDNQSNYIVVLCSVQRYLVLLDLNTVISLSSSSVHRDLDLCKK